MGVMVEHFALVALVALGVFRRGRTVEMLRSEVIPATRGARLGAHPFQRFPNLFDILLDFA